MKKMDSMTRTVYYLFTKHGPEHTHPKETHLCFFAEKRHSRNHTSLRQRVHFWAFRNTPEGVLIRTPFLRYEHTSAIAVLGGWNHYLKWNPWERRFILRNIRKAKRAEQIDRMLDKKATILHENDPYNKYD